MVAVQVSGFREPPTHLSPNIRANINIKSKIIVSS